MLSRLFCCQDSYAVKTLLLSRVQTTVSTVSSLKHSTGDKAAASQNSCAGTAVPGQLYRDSCTGTAVLGQLWHVLPLAPGGQLLMQYWITELYSTGLSFALHSLFCYYQFSQFLGSNPGQTSIFQELQHRFLCLSLQEISNLNFELLKAIVVTPTSALFNIVHHQHTHTYTNHIHQHTHTIVHTHTVHTHMRNNCTYEGENSSCCHIGTMSDYRPQLRGGLAVG